MAFTLQVRQKEKGFANPLDIPTLANACGFVYGSNDEFYILREGEQQNGTAILFHPDRIGRGIFLDCGKAEEGCYEVSYNIPTTRAEIADFARLVQEMERRLGSVEMYCVEEERYFTGKELEEGIEKFTAFSLKSLRDFAANKTYKSYILTLARWPYFIPSDKVLFWEACDNLSDFEETLHNLQARDVYYARPQLFQKKDTKEIGAFYALTEECASVFPIHAEGFLNLDGMKVHEGFIQFFLYQEQRAIEGLYLYESFMEEMLQRGVERFDSEHVLIPPMKKKELERLAKKLRP